MRYTRIHVGAHRRVNRFPVSGHLLAWVLPHHGRVGGEWESSHDYNNHNPALWFFSQCVEVYPSRLWLME